MKITVNEAKSYEAQRGLSVDDLTFDNVEDYKDVTFVLRGGNGTEVQIVGKFKAYDGTELVALDNGHHMTVKAFRNTYHTEDERDAFKSDEYGKAIIDAYVSQAKSLKFKVPAKDTFGNPNPGAHWVDAVAPTGERYHISVDCRASKVELDGHINDSDPFRYQEITFSKAKLLKKGTPKIAARSIVDEYPLPDFPQQYSR